MSPSDTTPRAGGLLLLYLTLSFETSLCSGQYECGVHGKFEYCIDEIPGCVVGCHCHPGYFFDTDTKMCEPNSKLLESHRRNNIAKPTRIHLPARPPPDGQIEQLATPGGIDAQVSGIKQDADDLGDWLYNQFFRTIENQVINNTDVKEIPTRRKMNEQSHKTLKREKNKKRRKQPSKKRGKKKNLKKKVMRITEDDSAFDVASSDSQETSDSSSSSDTSTDTESDSGERHGHKKIVMFQKKNKQPLPSFIFLPNRDTPFYPPLGLPPPPVMPMYPIVPVPPVLPMYQIPVLVPSTEGPTTNSTTSAQTPSILPTTVVTTTVTVPTDSPSTTPSKPDLTTSKKPSRSRNHHKAGLRERLKTKQEMKNAARQQMLQYLKSRNINIPPPLDQLTMPTMPVMPPIPQMNDYPLSQMPVIDNAPGQIPMNENDFPETFLLDEVKKPEPVAENVDFKYISELIHRADANKSKDENIISNHLNPIDHNYKTTKRKGQAGYNHMHSRRAYSLPNSNQEDTHYSNLGRQIASLIRNIDLKDKAINIEIAEQNNDNPNLLYYKNNSPSTFWERCVRSPLQLGSSNQNFEYLKRSNELLYNLENQVENVASTPRQFNLQELENIINVIQAAKKQIGREQDTVANNAESVPNNYNINLLPQEFHQYDNMQYPTGSHFKNKDIHGKPSIMDNNADQINMKKYITDTFRRSNTRDIDTRDRLGMPNQAFTNVKGTLDHNYIDNSSLPEQVVNIERRKENNPPFPPYATGQAGKGQRLNRIFPIHRNVYAPASNKGLLMYQRTTVKPSRYVQPSYFRNYLNQFNYIS